MNCFEVKLVEIRRLFWNVLGVWAFLHMQLQNLRLQQVALEGLCEDWVDIVKGHPLNHAIAGQTHTRNLRHWIALDEQEHDFKGTREEITAEPV